MRVRPLYELVGYCLADLHANFQTYTSRAHYILRGRAGVVLTRSYVL